MLYSSSSASAAGSPRIPSQQHRVGVHAYDSRTKEQEDQKVKAVLSRALPLNLTPLWKVLPAG